MRYGCGPDFAMRDAGLGRIRNHSVLVELPAGRAVAAYEGEFQSLVVAHRQATWAPQASSLFEGSVSFPFDGVL